MKFTIQDFYKVQYQANKDRVKNPDLREGQAFFNSLYKTHPDYANFIRTTYKDMFYVNDVLKALEVSLLLDAFEIKVKIIKETLKKIVINKKIPLQYRWDLFIKSNLGHNVFYYPSFNSYNIESYLSECYRYETLDSTDIILYMENIKVEENIINLVKEEILISFIKSYKYDW